MKAIWTHFSRFIWWLLDILFGIAVVIAIILIISVIFFPQDNLLLRFGKWLATKQF